MSYVGKVNTGQNDHLVAATVFGTCSTAADVAAKIAEENPLLAKTMTLSPLFMTLWPFGTKATS